MRSWHCFPKSLIEISFKLRPGLFLKEATLSGGWLCGMRKTTSPSRWNAGRLFERKPVVAIQYTLASNALT